MPAAIAAAVVSNAVGAAATTFFQSAFIGAVVGGVAGALTGQLVRSVFYDTDDDQGPGAQVLSEGRNVTVRQPISPWQYVYGETRVSGVISYIESTESNRYLHMVITMAAHESADIRALYFDDAEVGLDVNGDGAGEWAGFVRAHWSFGAETGQPFPALQAESAGKWTDAHRQTGHTKIYVRLTADRDRYPSGAPNITVKMKGRKVYDPRTGLTEWSRNPALILADYLCDDRIGLGADYDTEIDEALLIAAANICDETVTLADGTTESRYTCDGIVQASSTPEDIISAMLTAFAGTAVNLGGQWRIYAGAYQAPTVTLTEDDFRGPVRVQSRLSRRDSFNAVKGVFVSPDNFWQPTDFPPVTSAVYEAEDGERVWQDVRLAFTDSPTMAQRLAKIALQRARQPITVTCPLKLSAFALAPPDAVYLTLARFGWSSKVFEVVSATLAQDTGAEGAPVLGVDLVLRETSASVWSWSASEEGDFDPAPNTNLPDPFSAIAPGAPTVTEQVYETSGSAGVKTRAVLSASTADAFAAEYLYEIRAAGDSAYTALPMSRDPTMRVDDLAPGVYDVRLRTRNQLGAQSAYSAVTRATLRGITDPPSDVTGFSVVASSGFALASWTRHPDLDVRIGGRILIRHSPQSSGVGWNEATIVGEFPGGITQGLVPLVTGTYFAKALDSAGFYSETAASFVATEGLVTGLSVIDSVQEDATFPGVKTSLSVDGSVLTISSGVLLDSISGNVDDYAMWDSAGGQSLTGTYEFDAVLDCTTVAVRRFESDLDATAVHNNDFVDSRLGNVDDWPGLMDGDVIEGWDVVLYASLTDDDPVGSPTASWSDWRPFRVADFSCRAAKFKAEFRVANAAHNIEVSTLRVAAKA